ncbi:hypothetical protein ACG7TL_005883 [Trametes sanguinea]
MPNKRCTKCISRRAECTYVEPFHKSRYTDSYVENLEQRLRRMEALLDKLNAGAEAKKVIESDVLDIETPQTVDSQTQPTTSPEASTSTSAGISPLAMAPPTPPAPETPDEEDLSDDDVAVQRDIIQGINKLSLNPSTLRYHGKSSGWVFIQTTAGLRQEYIRQPTPPSSNDMTPLPQGRRLVLIDPKISYQYEPQPWLERPFLDPLLSLQDFPPHDLLWELLELYFRHINDTTPLLHKPTFMQSIREGLHLRHGGFGATVLLACALGSRYSHDPRVLLDGSDSWRSAGWKWYQKVEDMHKSPLAPVQLYDVQICAFIDTTPGQLMTMYIQGTTSPQTTWVLIGIGIRKALDVGAHRKSMYKTQPTIEDELWRRAFWTLMFLEIWSSYGLGRPPCIHEEEYDVALPTECDDEYWVNDDPRLAFKQPPGKPSTVSFYVTCLRLSKIVAYALRTIFSIRKTRTQLGNGDQQWEERIVAQLDSELNKWLDSIPEHLKWDPNREEEVFLRQSATLHASYYTAQIAVHRSFITSRRQSSHALASLIICTNAARSCVKVLYQLCQRTGTPLARNAGLLFSSGLVLLMSMWGQRRSGRYSSANRDQEYVQQCIDMLKIVEREYHVAERLRDMLRSFLSLDTPTVEAQSSDAFQAQKGSTTSAGPAEAGGEPSHASGEERSSSVSRRETSDPVEIWDVRRGYIAKWVVNGSAVEGGVTDIDFGDSHALWALHSSGTFSQLDLRQCRKPLDAIPRSAISWNTTGSIAFVTDRSKRWEIPYDDIDPEMNKDKPPVKGLGDRPFRPATQNVGAFAPDGAPEDLEMIEKLARGYIYEGKEKRLLCAYNAEIAANAGAYDAAQTWNLLESLLTDLNLPPSPPLSPLPLNNPPLPHSSSAPAAIPTVHTVNSPPAPPQRSMTVDASLYPKQKDNSPGSHSKYSDEKYTRRSNSGHRSPRKITPTSSTASSPRKASTGLPSVPAALFARRESATAAAQPPTRPRLPSSFRRPSFSTQSILSGHSESPSDNLRASLRHVGEGALDDSDSSESGSNEDATEGVDDPKGASDHEGDSTAPSASSRATSATYLHRTTTAHPSPLSRVAGKQTWTEDEKDDEDSPSPGSTSESEDGGTYYQDEDDESGGERRLASMPASTSTSRRPSLARTKRRSSTRSKTRSRSSTVASLAVSPAPRTPFSGSRRVARQESRSSIRTVTVESTPSGTLSRADGALRRDETVRDLSGGRAGSLKGSQTLSRPKSEAFSHDFALDQDQGGNGFGVRMSLGETGAQTPLSTTRTCSDQTKAVIREAEEKFRELAWETVRERFEQYADEGDVIMCAMLSLVVPEELKISRQRVTRFVEAYIDILNRLRLHTCAAYMRKFVPLDDVKATTSDQWFVLEDHLAAMPIAPVAKRTLSNAPSVTSRFDHFCTNVQYAYTGAIKSATALTTTRGNHQRRLLLHHSRLLSGDVAVPKEGTFCSLFSLVTDEDVHKCLETPSVKQFLDDVAANPERAASYDQLTLSYTSEYLWYLWPPSPPAPVTRVIEMIVVLCNHLPEVRDLKLNGFQFNEPALYSLLTVAGRIPTIESLYLFDLELESDQSPPWPHASVESWSASAGGSSRWALQRLLLGGGRFPTAELRSLVSFLERSRESIPLKSLELCTSLLKHGPVTTVNCPGAPYTLGLCHYGVTTNDISRNGTIYKPGRENMSRLLSDLRRCSTLRSLRLDYDASIYVFNRRGRRRLPFRLPAHFIDALADMLNPCWFWCAPPPLPALERLQLVVHAPHDWLRGWKWAFARLADALVGDVHKAREKRRYPQFARLEVHSVILPYMAAGGPLPGSAGKEEIELQRNARKEDLLLPMLDPFVKAGVDVVVAIY